MSINGALFPNGKLQQAYLLLGTPVLWREILTASLQDFLQVDNLHQSVDVWWQSYESFGLKDSHLLIEKESRRALTDQGRFFVLEIFSITPEAQNALLKTFEEPSTDTHFFIIAGSAEIFLPTLRSRLTILTSLPSGSSVVTDPAVTDLVDRFLALTGAERLDFIRQTWLQRQDKTKSEIFNFVIELERRFRQKINFAHLTTEAEASLLALEKSRRYLDDPRSSSRLILENLALTLPTISPSE